MNIDAKNLRTETRNGARRVRKATEATPGAVFGRDIAQMAASIVEARHRERKATAIAAYFLAEKRGFSGGHEFEDWLAAKGEVTHDHASSPPS